MTRATAPRRGAPPGHAAARHRGVAHGGAATGLRKRWLPRISEVVREPGFETAVTATLSVRDWARAVDFYKAAFGAREIHRVPGGGVAQLSVGGAEFWVAEESPEHKNFSSETLGGCSVRMLLVVEDPAAVCARAVAAGATQVYPVADSHGWRIGRIVDPAGHHWEIGKPLPG